MINLTKKQREEELLANRHQAALADLMRDHKTQFQNGELYFEAIFEFSCTSKNMNIKVYSLCLPVTMLQAYIQIH